MNDYFFSKDNVHLRLIHNEDKDIFLKWYNDIEIRKNIGGLIPFSEAEFKDACHMVNRINPPSLWFCICVDKRVIGVSGLHQIRYVQRNAEVSILIGEQEFKNRGFGTKTIEMLMEYGFDFLQMHRLYANIFSDNNPSIRLFTKCGWMEEGTLRDAAFWDKCYRDIKIFGVINHKDKANT